MVGGGYNLTLTLEVHFVVTVARLVVDTCLRLSFDAAYPNYEASVSLNIKLKHMYIYVNKYIYTTINMKNKYYLHPKKLRPTIDQSISG